MEGGSESTSAAMVPPVLCVGLGAASGAALKIQESRKLLSRSTELGLSHLLTLQLIAGAGRGL